MTMVVMRVTSVPVLAVITWFALRQDGFRGLSPGPSGAEPWDCLGRPRHRRVRRCCQLVVRHGIRVGGVAIVAVLGSLYPAATVLLARVIDQERLSRIQNIGVLAAVAGVTLIAAGS